MPNYGQFRFTRVGGPTPDAPDVYSPSKNGWVSPGFFESPGPRNGRGCRCRPGRPMPKPRPMAKRSGRNLQRTIRHFWCWTASSKRSRSTRWLSSRKAALPGTTPDARTSISLSACNRPHEIATAIAYLLGNAQAAFRPAHINTNFASCGGGFGGRDHTPFPLYVALAAMFFPDRPVRLANNRFEQFQLGIKRHAFKIRTRIGVDRATGKIVGFAADHALDGGGLANFSVKWRPSALSPRSAFTMSRRSI